MAFVDQNLANTKLASPCYNCNMLQILLPPDTESALRERAKANGEDVASYAAHLLQQALCTPSVEELLAPFREQVEKSGISDEELDQLGDELRRDARQSNHARSAESQ